MTLAVLSLLAANLVTNFDQSQARGLDIVAGWDRHIKDGLHISLEVVPLGDGAVRFISRGEPYAFYEQRGLTLVPGAKYRLSFEVRTGGLGGARPKILLRDSKWSWKREQESPVLPDDTKGRWVRVEKVLAMCANTGAKEHTLSISCLMDRPVRESVFDLRDLRLEAVEPAVAAKSAPVAAAALAPLPARIVPIDPLLAQVNADAAEMTLFWPARPAGGLTNCTLEAVLDGARRATGRFGADARAKVAWGAAKPGRHAVALTVRSAQGETLATNGYAIVAVRPVKAETVGRRLNNLVTELVNAPLKDGDVMFSRSRPGWVWISFEGETGPAEGFLDTIGFPVVRRRTGERRLETQRFVAAGVHTLRVVGATGGRLRIHAVKTIAGTAEQRLDSEMTKDYWGARYSLPFLNRYDAISTFNTVSRRTNTGLCTDDLFLGYTYERGIRFVPELEFGPKHPDRSDAAATYRNLTEGPWTFGLSVNVDENIVGAAPAEAVNYSEAVWRMIGQKPELSVNVFYADTSYGRFYDCPPLNASEISATVNSGNGTGILYPELYSMVGPTRAALDAYLDRAAKFLESAVGIVPAARDAVVLYGASYVDIGDWSNYVTPGTDIKAHVAAMFRAYATDPRFADCAGIGFGGSMCGDEELRRWGVRCIRHYALEGGTDDLAEVCRFAWTPGHLKNPDMEEGLTNWTTKGAVAAERIRGYGKRLQQRQGVRDGVGDGVATFTFAAAAPNELAQTLTGLEPGRLYSVLCCVADRAAIEKAGRPIGPAAPIAFSARVEGAKEIPMLRYDRIRTARRQVTVHTIRYVFEATAPTARLVFTDRNDDGSANVEEGLRQSLNYISVKPYYTEATETTDDVAAALGWTDGDRIRWPKPHQW